VGKHAVERLGAARSDCFLLVVLFDRQPAVKP
jgi:hypothetical protein